MNPSEVRFAADGMLQSLAKWLRILGYDCAAGGGLFGLALVERALAERRWVLTRNRRFGTELPEFLLERSEIFPVAAEHLSGQLREVADRFSLEPAAFRFTRCLICNEPLEAVPKPSDPDGVPREVLERERHFWRCPRCERYFWRGSHVRRSVDRIDRWLAP